MRELTEEEAAMVSGGATEGALLETSSAQRLVGPAFGAHRGFSGLFQPIQPMPKFDIRTDIDSMIRES